MKLVKISAYFKRPNTGISNYIAKIPQINKSCKLTDEVYRSTWPKGACWQYVANECVALTCCELGSVAQWDSVLIENQKNPIWIPLMWFDTQLIYLTQSDFFCKVAFVAGDKICNIPFLGHLNDEYTFILRDIVSIIYRCL